MYNWSSLSRDGIRSARVAVLKIARIEPSGLVQWFRNWDVVTLEQVCYGVATFPRTTAFQSLSEARSFVSEQVDHGFSILDYA